MTDIEKVEFIDRMTETIYDWCATEKVKIKLAIKEGLEKGLAEGRKDQIDWHDLREDPNDLPKEKGEYWTKYNDYNEEKCGYYDSHYYDPDNPSYKLKWYKLDVIAWCEHPKFNR